MKNWEQNPKTKLASVNAVNRVLRELLVAGLTPNDIIACYVSCRVSPLQRRTHKIC
jgi:hypothetical protein